MKLCVASAIAASILIVGAYADPPRTTQPSRSPASKRDSAREEQSLRARLDFAPHDRNSYERLLRLLKDRYAFRAQALLDADWLRNNPGDYFALIDLTSCATVALHDPEFAIAAEREYLRTTQRDPSDTTYDFVMSSLASELSKRGWGDEALRLSDQLLTWTPADPGLWADRAAIQFRMTRVDEAIACLRRSVDLNPGSESVHESLGDLYFASGEIEDAVSEYRAAVSVYDAKYSKGETADTFSQLMGSMIKVSRKFQSEHTLALMHMKHARALIQLGRSEEAIVATRAAVAADRSAVAAFYLRAKAYEAANDMVNAQKARDAVLPAIMKLASKEEIARSRKIGDPRVSFLADVDTSDFAPLDFSDELIALLSERSGPLTVIEKIMLADALISRGEISEGRPLWEAVLVAGTAQDTAQGHAALATALLKAGDVEHALPHLRRAYELDPLNMTYRADYDMHRVR